MAGTVTFAGIGSGMDIESLISGLTKVEQQPISQEKSRLAGYRSASTTLSNVSGLLAKLKLAASTLDTAQEVGSFKASSSGSAIAVSASGSAQPGSYSVTVNKLATEQRTYSNEQSSASSALNLSGTFELGVGTGTPKSIQVEATDTLNTLVDKINGAGLRVSASTFYDGSKYRLQIRGLDSGDDNYLTFGAAGGIGDQLGLLDTDNTKQKAQSAEVTIDKFTVKSATNQVTGAIPGVTLALKEEGATNKITVDRDPTALGDNLQKVVDAYNAVITQIHTAAGYGQTSASNPALQSDPTLRSVASRLSSTLLSSVGNGKSQTLGAIGVSLNNDGTLKVDRAKLDKALTADAASVSAVLAGPASGGDGIMDMIQSVADKLTDPKNGVLQVRQDGFDTRAKNLQDQIDREQARVTAYTEQLRKTFTQMDTTVAQYNSQLSSLSAISVKG